jgi:hypothetical protein
VRPLFANELHLLDSIDDDVESWELAYEAIRNTVTLRYPEGHEVPEFLLHLDGNEARWRWSDEPFDGKRPSAARQLSGCGSAGPPRPGSPLPGSGRAGLPAPVRWLDNGQVSVESLPSRFANAASRVPGWDEFCGPDSGAVDLPTRLCWSGSPRFSIDDPLERLALYTTLSDAGQRHDIARHINRDLLAWDWPRMRRLTSRELIGIWEERPPILATV